MPTIIKPLASDLDGGELTPAVSKLFGSLDPCRARQPSCTEPVSIWVINKKTTRLCCSQGAYWSFPSQPSNVLWRSFVPTAAHAHKIHRNPIKNKTSLTPRGTPREEASQTLSIGMESYFKKTRRRWDRVNTIFLLGGSNSDGPSHFVFRELDCNADGPNHFILWGWGLQPWFWCTKPPCTTVILMYQATLSLYLQLQLLCAARQLERCSQLNHLGCSLQCVARPLESVQCMTRPLESC